MNYIASWSVSPGGGDSKTGEVTVQGFKICSLVEFSTLEGYVSILMYV